MSQNNRMQTPEAVLFYEREKLSQRKYLIKVCITTFIVTAIICSIMLFGIGFAKINDTSMSPSIKEGDVAVFSRIAKTYKENDVIIFNHGNQKNYVKRIVAVSGQTVSIDDSGTLLIDNKIPTEEIFYPTTRTGTTVTFPLTVGEGKVFVLGDNRTNSMDSRDFGLVDIKDIKGKVMTIIFRSKV